MKYKIQWNDDINKMKGTKDVIGTRVVIPGFEQFHFFVHDIKFEHDIWIWNGWRVSEATSGALISKGWSTKEDAIIGAKDILNRQGIKNLKKAIARKIKKYGVINK
jgi:hypothetical protein